MTAVTETFKSFDSTRFQFRFETTDPVTFPLLDQDDDNISLSGDEWYSGSKEITSIRDQTDTFPIIYIEYSNLDEPTFVSSSPTGVTVFIPGEGNVIVGGNEIDVMSASGNFLVPRATLISGEPTVQWRNVHGIVSPMLWVDIPPLYQTTLSFSASYSPGLVTVHTTSSNPNYPINDAHLTFCVENKQSTNARTVPITLQNGRHRVYYGIRRDDDWGVTVSNPTFFVNVSPSRPEPSNQTSVVLATLFVIGSVVVAL